jgi:hypothetical protein
MRGIVESLVPMIDRLKLAREIAARTDPASSTRHDVALINLIEDDQSLR